jgi:cobalt-zinc-cadmium efflux system outer membrane protein
MSLHKRQILMVALLVSAAGAVRAATTSRDDGSPRPADPVLDALVAEALAANPELGAAEDTAAAAAARPDQAGALPDPMLSVLYTNDGWGISLGERMMTNLAFVWSQTLPWPGKRELRSSVAARDADLAEQQRARVRLSVAAAVKRAYYGMLLARETLEVVAKQEETARDVEGVARSRYAVGQGAEQDVLRAQIEVTRMDELRAEQEAEAEVRLAELNRLLARPPGTPLVTPARLALEPELRTLEEVQAWAEPSSPELQAAGILVERERLASDLASRVGQPDLVVQGGYMNRAGLDPMWQAGVGVTLPVSGRKKAGVRAEAEAELRAAEKRRESVRLDLRYRNQERLAQLRSTERVARLYADGIVPQAEMSVEAAIASYQAGQVPFVAVLEALTTLYDDRRGYLRLLARHAQLAAGLDELSLVEAPAVAVAQTGGSSSAAVGQAGMSGMQD